MGLFDGKLIEFEDARIVAHSGENSVAFVRLNECVPNSFGSNPVRPIHSETRRAYWRVVMPLSGLRRPSEQELTSSFVGHLQIIIDALAGLLAQFKPDRPSSFLLSDGCVIRRVAAGSYILDPDGDDITPAS